MLGFRALRRLKGSELGVKMDACKLRSTSCWMRSGLENIHSLLSTPDKERLLGPAPNPSSSRGRTRPNSKNRNPQLLR